MGVCSSIIIIALYFIFRLLLLSGDIEFNPGPITGKIESYLIIMCHVCVSMSSLTTPTPFRTIGDLVVSLSF